MAENEKLKGLREKAMRLPLQPGVYLMKNKSGKIIYIGKAKALKNRVSQYFGSQTNHPPKVRKMVEHVDDFDYILTGDLGRVGGSLLKTLLRNEDIDIAKQHKDCGTMIFNVSEQDVHSGASGCGCSGRCSRRYSPS